MNLQFFHDRVYTDFKRTIALEVPTRIELESLFLPGSLRKIKLKFGVANCSEKDQYVKKIGRELASSRLQEFEFTLSHVWFDDINIFLRLNSSDEMITFRLSGNSEKPHYIGR